MAKSRLFSPEEEELNPIANNDFIDVAARYNQYPFELYNLDYLPIRKLSTEDCSRLSALHIFPEDHVLFKDNNVSFTKRNISTCEPGIRLGDEPVSFF